MKIALSVILVIVLGILAIHDLPYLASSAGRCMLQQQPDILLGSAPSLTVQLECALSAPDQAPALPQCADPQDVNPIGCTQPPSPPPSPAATPVQTVQPPTDALPRGVHYGTAPAGYPVPAVNGATWWTLVNCRTSQCTTLPGAGPRGSTCGEPVRNRQVCVG